MLAPLLLSIIRGYEWEVEITSGADDIEEVAIQDYFFKKGGYY